MTALADNLDTPRHGGLIGIDSFPVGASKTIYQGGLVSVLKSGAVTAYAQAAGDTANTICKGVAMEKADNSSGSAGDINVKVGYGEFEFTSAGLSASNEGSPVYVADDQTVKLKAATTNDVPCGIITKVISATSAKIRITPESIRAAANFG